MWAVSVWMRVTRRPATHRWLQDQKTAPGEAAVSLRSAVVAMAAVAVLRQPREGQRLDPPADELRLGQHSERLQLAMPVRCEQGHRRFAGRCLEWHV